jgi:hypothetical protein
LSTSLFLYVFSRIQKVFTCGAGILPVGSGALGTSGARARRLLTSASELIPKLTKARQAHVLCISSVLSVSEKKEKQT